jgi:hypothetical protein
LYIPLASHNIHNSLHYQFIGSFTWRIPTKHYYRFTCEVGRTCQVSKSNGKQLLARKFQALQLFRKVHPPISDLRALLSELFANSMTVWTIDTKVGVKRTKDITLDAANKVVVDGKWDIVCEALIRN